MLIFGILPILALFHQAFKVSWYVFPDWGMWIGVEVRKGLVALAGASRTRYELAATGQSRFEEYRRWGVVGAACGGVTADRSSC